MLIFEWKNVILADIKVSIDISDTVNDVERKIFLMQDEKLIIL